MPETTTAAASAFDADAYFEAIWRGEVRGCSKARAEARLEDYEHTLADLNANRISPRRVIGKGVRKPKTTARAWLTAQIAAARRDLATQGRTNPVNIDNVAYNAPAGHPRKAHRIRYVADDKYPHLWQATCNCGWHEAGWSAVTTHTPAAADAHIANQAQ